MRHTQVVTLTIPNGQQVSNTLQEALGTSGAPVFESFDSLVVYSPAALTGTVTAQAAPTFGGTFVNLSLQGTDITIPAARAVIIPASEFGDFRMASGSAEGASRAFQVILSIEL